MRMRRSQQGSALGSTLLIVLFLVIFALTLVNLATFDLRTTGRNGQKQLALNAADAGLERVISEISRNPKIGLANEVFTETLSDKSRYRVTFDQTQSDWSLNNLANISGQVGNNSRPVPPLHAYILSEGTSPAGETALVECLIRLEAIPYAVAGTGKVNLNSVIVAGSNRLSEAGSATLAGHVYSGATGAGSLNINGLSQVSGDARSVGDINVGVLANVVGDVDGNRSPDTLPNLEITDFENSGKPGVTPLPGGINVAPVLMGDVFINGSVTLTGPVTLVDANVYVAGNLTVNGPITGSGTVFVNGETTFLVGVFLTGSNRLTLFSDGDINLLLPSIFQGVLYTHGNVNAGGLLATTVLGAVYAVSGDTTKGFVTLGPGSTVVHVSEMTGFASSFLGLSGEADAIRVFWNRLR